MKRLCKNYNIGQTVKVKDPNMTGVYTIIGQDGNGNYTLWDGQQQYDNVPNYDIVSSEEFTVGSQVRFKDDPSGTTYTIKNIIADDTYYIENDDNSFTGIRGKALELV